MKFLYAEDDGLVLYIKRLEEGTFRLPEYDQQSKSYPMEWRDLVMMVEGINNGSAKRLKRLKALRKSDIVLFKILINNDSDRNFRTFGSHTPTD